MSDKPIDGHAYIMSMANEIISLRAERDALRDLLREWRNHWPCSPELRASIDAILEEKNHER